MHAKADANAEANPAWPEDIFSILKRFDVRQVPYVPDAGHSQLINRVIAEPSMHAVSLTTEEEGVALLAGAWAGGQRGVLLMQSSGVGNCINMLSLIATCRFPLLALVTMRGEWGEFNSWQVPMGQATPEALAIMGVQVHRVDAPEAAAPTVAAAAAMAFDGDQAVAVLLSQRLLGRKTWVAGEEK